MGFPVTVVLTNSNCINRAVSLSYNGAFIL